ncbi:hypothetical protein L345_10303 [Ophiophagus hannah]|uniref:C2 domain-containing protein n=1 Tax=Ophiophagus hannah TaxID=8665 RepID=V8NPC5_OPHHA|nr:hypothetical protein L345_10303 [Ophiophagus hannah]
MGANSSSFEGIINNREEPEKGSQLMKLFVDHYCNLNVQPKDPDMKLDWHSDREETPFRLLTVRIMRARNIKKADILTESDCYVSLSLPTSSSEVVKTETVPNSKNPEWNQAFTYRIDSRIKTEEELDVEFKLQSMIQRPRNRPVVSAVRNRETPRDGILALGSRWISWLRKADVSTLSLQPIWDCSLGVTSLTSVDKERSVYETLAKTNVKGSLQERKTFRESGVCTESQMVSLMKTGLYCNNSAFVLRKTAEAVDVNVTPAALLDTIAKDLKTLDCKPPRLSGNQAAYEFYQIKQIMNVLNSEEDCSMAKSVLEIQSRSCYFSSRINKAFYFSETDIRMSLYFGAEQKISLVSRSPHPSNYCLLKYIYYSKEIGPISKFARHDKQGMRNRRKNQRRWGNFNAIRKEYYVGNDRWQLFNTRYDSVEMMSSPNIILNAGLRAAGGTDDTVSADYRTFPGTEVSKN